MSALDSLVVPEDGAPATDLEGGSAAVSAVLDSTGGEWL